MLSKAYVNLFFKLKHPRRDLYLHTSSRELGEALSKHHDGSHITGITHVCLYTLRPRYHRRATDTEVLKPSKPRSQLWPHSRVKPSRPPEMPSNMVASFRFHAQVSASTVVRGTISIAAFTVGTTTIVSVVHGDAPSLPMISDTFVKAPESYVSRLGVVTVATLLQLIVWFLHSYLCVFAAPTYVWRMFTFVHTLLGAVGAAALGLVGAVSDQENFPVHFDAATTFFVAILVWQLGYTTQLMAHQRATSPKSLRIKCACGISTCTGLVGFFTLAAIDFEGFYREMALCEWTAAISSMVSVWSLSAEFSGEARGGRCAGGERGMELGSLWRGSRPGAGEELDAAGAEMNSITEVVDVGGGEYFQLA